MLGISIITTILFFAATQFFFWRFRSEGIDLGIPDGSIFFQFLDDLQIKMNSVLIVIVAAIFIIFLILGLVFSHRIAGPIYRLNRHLREVGNGDHMNDVKFRKNDFFPELADAFNWQIKRFR